MSSNYELILIILNGLQDIDLNSRREAEKQLEVMKEKNITELLFLLSTVLSSITYFNYLRFKSKEY